MLALRCGHFPGRGRGGSSGGYAQIRAIGKSRCSGKEVDGVSKVCGVTPEFAPPAKMARSCHIKLLLEVSIQVRIVGARTEHVCFVFQVREMKKGMRNSIVEIQLYVGRAMSRSNA